MKTKCYCIYCKKHPKHKELMGERAFTGFHVNDAGLWAHKEHGADVECLYIDEGQFPFMMDADEFNFPVTAYGDGVAMTRGDYIFNSNLTLETYCAGEYDEQLEAE